MLTATGVVTCVSKPVRWAGISLRSAAACCGQLWKLAADGTSISFDYPVLCMFEHFHNKLFILLKVVPQGDS